MSQHHFYPTLDCLSTEMFQSVTAKDLKVLNQLFILFRIAKRDLTLKYLYIQPSEIYIRSKTGFSIGGISRSITRLTKAGIIRTTHRRMRYGKWQTNLYHLGDMILNMVPWMRKYLNKKASEPFDRIVKLEDKEPLKKDPEDEEYISYSEYLRVSAKMQGD